MDRPEWEQWLAARRELDLAWARGLSSIRRQPMRFRDGMGRIDRAALRTLMAGYGLRSWDDER